MGKAVSDLEGVRAGRTPSSSTSCRLNRRVQAPSSFARNVAAGPAWERASPRERRPRRRRRSRRALRGTRPPSRRRSTPVARPESFASWVLPSGAPAAVVRVRPRRRQARPRPRDRHGTDVSPLRPPTRRSSPAICGPRRTPSASSGRRGGRSSGNLVWAFSCNVAALPSAAASSCIRSSRAWRWRFLASRSAPTRCGCGASARRTTAAAGWRSTGEAAEVRYPAWSRSRSTTHPGPRRRRLRHSAVRSPSRAPSGQQEDDLPTERNPVRRRSRAVQLAVVPLLAAAFLAGCVTEESEETAYWRGRPGRGRRRRELR